MNRKSKCLMGAFKVVQTTSVNKLLCLIENDSTNKAENKFSIRASILSKMLSTIRAGYFHCADYMQHLYQKYTLTFRRAVFLPTWKGQGRNSPLPLPISHKIIFFVIFFPTEYHDLISGLGSIPRSQLKAKERKRKFSVICLLCSFCRWPKHKNALLPNFHPIFVFSENLDFFENPPNTHTKYFFVRFRYFALQMTQNIKSQKAMAPQRLKCGYNYKETCRGGAYLVCQVLSFGSYGVVSLWFAGTHWQGHETSLPFIQSSHPGGMLCRVFAVCYGWQVGFWPVAV